MGKKGLFLILATSLISGVSIFINKFGVSGIDADVFTFMKNVIVAVLLFSIMLAFSKFSEIKSLTRKQWFQLSAIGLIGGAIPFILFFNGLKIISAASVGSFIHKTMFLFVAVIAFFYLKEKFDWKIFLSAALLLAGLGLMIGVYYFKTFGYGEALILAATLFWAFENVLSKKALKELSGNTVAFGRMFFGSLFILAYLFAAGKYTLIITINQPQLIWILIASALLFAYVITWYNGLKQVSVITATQILLLGLPVTMALDFVFSGKALAVTQLIGIILVVSAVAFVAHTEIRRLKQSKHSKQSQPHIHNAL